MSPSWQASHGLLIDVLVALTSASWRKAEIFAESLLGEPMPEDESRHLFLHAVCSIRDNARFSDRLSLLAEHSLSAAVQLSIAGVHLSLCYQSICISQVDRATREALAFGWYAMSAAHSIGFTLSESEQEMMLELASSLPVRIESQQSLSLAIALGFIPKRMLFVLGMHRSGTSALVGLLSEMGLDPPKDLIPPSKYNPKGYFESTGILAENDRLLSALGTSWQLDKPLPRGWIDQQFASVWRQALLHRLQVSFGGVSCPVIKDPRFCVLMAGLSSWLQIDAVDFRFIMPVRHPLEVVNSLLARPEGPIGKDTSLRLWIESVLSAERMTRGMPRMVVIADDLFDSSADVQSELQNFIQQDISTSASEAASSFVDPALRHHSSSHEMLRQPTLGMSKCAVLQDLAMRIYDEIKINKANQYCERLDELYCLWLHLA